MGEVLSFRSGASAARAKAPADLPDSPDFEYLFLSNLIVRLGAQGYPSVSRAISTAAANLSGTGIERRELDGLVDLGLSLIAQAGGSNGS